MIHFSKIYADRKDMFNNNNAFTMNNELLFIYVKRIFIMLFIFNKNATNITILVEKLEFCSVRFNKYSKFVY